METIINHIEEVSAVLYDFVNRTFEKTEPDLIDLFDPANPDLLRIDNHDIYLTDIQIENVRYCIWFDPEYSSPKEKVENILKAFWDEQMPGFTNIRAGWEEFYSWKTGIAYRGGQGDSFKLWKYHDS